MPIAKVHTVGPPIKVQMKGDTTGTTPALKSSTLASVAVGDDVWVDVDSSDRKVVILHKLAANT